MAELDVFLILNIVFIVFSAIASFGVYSKYRQRKTDMIKFLLALFIFYTIYLTAVTIQLWIATNNKETITTAILSPWTFPLLPEILANPSLASYVVFYTLDLTLAVVTSIIAFNFKNVTFTGEQKSKLSIFVKYLGYGTLSLAICVIFSINLSYTIVVDFFVTLHLFLVYLPFTMEAFKSFKRTGQMNIESRYRWGFFFIALMALCFVLRNVFLYIDFGVAVGVYHAAAGDNTVHTEFNIVAMIFLIAAYIAAYFGYIWPGRKR